jgi:hypothetical protein
MRLYRAVHNPPTERDMLSASELGRRCPTPAKKPDYDGVSVYLTAEQCRVPMRAWPKIGTHVAELEVPESVTRQPANPDGHVRLDGATPGQLLSYVVAIHPGQETVGRRVASILKQGLR